MITRPNCKINLGLNVMRRRHDGYHDLETIFLPVAINDVLEIDLSEQFSFKQDGIPIGGEPDSNIVVKAWQLLRGIYGGKVGNVAIHLTKNIPFGAGLGGGSSDAAFTLKMLNELFSLELDADTLRRHAASLGADCPFFIDNSPALATGIGDQLTPLGFNPLQGHQLLLVKPNETVSTAEAYRGVIPREKRQDIVNTDLQQAIMRPVKEWQNLVFNDFETSVFETHPLLGSIKQELYSAGALYAAMSGSGSTVYGIFPLSADHQNLEKKLTTYGKLFTMTIS